MAKEGREFILEVPLDASGVKGFKPDRAVKVAAYDRKGASYERTVKLDAQGKGSASFTFTENPGVLRVVLGPEKASAQDLKHLQTLSVNVSGRYWQEKAALKISPIAITDYYWWWWYLWCREFKIHGRLLCADGTAVPNAQVCAYDVDWFWWWWGEQQVGCATTDATGAFEIDFTWCCGWWPWYWWELRDWRLETNLAERILPLLQTDPRLARLPRPGPTPDLAVFNQLLGTTLAANRQASGAFNPAALEALRAPLAQRFQANADLERWCVWPWCPWWPWLDCAPDLVFRATQNCRGQNVVVLNEDIFSVHNDIPTDFTVTLTANDQACCVADPCTDLQNCPEGNCIFIYGACVEEPSAAGLLNDIGGNFGAAAAPVGYENPGTGTYVSDRPYAGAVTITGDFGDTAGVDYYAFQWATSLGGPWSPIPLSSFGGFTRYYAGPPIGGPPFLNIGIYGANFPVQNIGGINVLESREHFELNNDPTSWGPFFTPGDQRQWADGRDLLMQWVTEGTNPDGSHFTTIANGTYYLQVVGYTLSGGVLTPLPTNPLVFCDTSTANYIVLTLDNRLVGPAAGHPVDHPCGSGTVHLCTTEPDCNIFDVRIDGVSAGPCTMSDASKGGSVEIDFMAHDPNGNLCEYTLVSTYGLDCIVDLLGLVGAGKATLTPGPAHGGISPAAQVGPDYGSALTQGAVSPTWTGGTFTLTIPNVTDAFPVTCCYQLQLWAYKRTIYNCYYGIDGHANLTEYSLTVTTVPAAPGSCFPAP